MNGPQNRLKTFRENFACSQEAIAASLNVSVRTIRRWERAPVFDVNPFASAVWATISRYSVHLSKYAQALLPDMLLQSVTLDSKERSLLVGPEAVVVAMSHATRKNWGIYRHFEGMSIAAFMDKELKGMVAQNYNEIRDISISGDHSRLMYFVTKSAPPGSTPPLWRKHTIQIVFPLVHDIVSRPISEEEYNATTQKVWLEHVRVSAEPL